MLRGLLLLLLAGAALAARRPKVAPTPFAQFTPCAGGANASCVIPAGRSVEITTSVHVRSLVVYGKLLVNPPKGTPITITTGFFVAIGNASAVNISAPTWAYQVTIFLERRSDCWQDVPLAYMDMFSGGRVFGSADGAKVAVFGAPLKNTFGLLAANAYANQTKITVAGDVSDWRVGMRFAIAPSDSQYQPFSSQPDALSTRPGAFNSTITSIVEVVKGQRYDIGFADKLPWYTFPKGVNPIGYPASVYPTFHGDEPSGIQSEVFVLDRNIIITGSPFAPSYRELPQPPWPNPSPNSNGQWPQPWSQWARTNFSGEGLHTLAWGHCPSAYAPCTSGGGWMKIWYTRVDTAGQRGWIGRYPLHFHKMGNCPECHFKGNVVTQSQQRGIVVHSTYNSLVEENIVFAVKGAGYYVEEGTEMGNTLKNNVYACDSGVYSFAVWDGKEWTQAKEVASGSGGGCQADSLFDFGDPSVVLGGCRILGTDNEQADCVQQAGIWSLSASNNFIGNRISNAYNGIYFQSTHFAQGRPGTDDYHRVCPIHSPFGVVSGNVVHSCGRFGWYPDSNYPRKVGRSVGTNGYVPGLDYLPNQYQPLPAQCMSNLTNPEAWCGCRGTLLNGTDNSQDPTYIDGQFDWGNQYVGQYDLSDVGYRKLKVVNSNNMVYWKGSKNFAQGEKPIAHIKDSVFIYSQSRPLALGTPYPQPPPLQPSFTANGVNFIGVPGLSGTFIIENVAFVGYPAYASWMCNENTQSGAGGALAINQQCKGGQSFSSKIDGSLCTPQIILKNVSFEWIVDTLPGAPSNQLPTWIFFGAESGNPYLGSVNAYDDSLCGGYSYNGQAKCPLRAVVSRYNTHLVNMPDSPCSATLPSTYTKKCDISAVSDWGRRFHGGIVCTKQVRRLTIFGFYQPTQVKPANTPATANLILIPPGTKASSGYQMFFMAFNMDNPPPSYPPDVNRVMGTSFAPLDEERRWSEGYGANAMSNETYPGVWKLTKQDGTWLDLSLVRYMEFSDQMFDGENFPVDTLLLQLGPNAATDICTLKSTDKRLFMTPFGPTQRGGGSCLDILAKHPLKPSPPPP